MNTLIVTLLLAGQFDLFSAEKQEIYSVDFSQIGEALPIAPPPVPDPVVGVASPQKPPEDLPMIDGYAPSWCTGCKLAVKECEVLKDIVDIHWHSDSKQYPEPVKNLIANGGVYPVLWWTTPSGPRQISNGWKGVYDFTTRYDKTMMVVPGKTVSMTVVTPPVKTLPHYPVRGGWWDQDGHYVTWQHLTQGEHYGKFDPAWLQTLSYQEVNSLHSDDHEGRVQWQYVVRGSRAVQQAAPTVQYAEPRRVGPIKRLLGVRG